MMLYFNWNSGTAASRMIEVLKKYRMDWFYSHLGGLCTRLNGKTVMLDYEQVNGNTFRIMEKRYERIGEQQTRPVLTPLIVS